MEFEEILMASFLIGMSGLSVLDAIVLLIFFALLIWGAKNKLGRKGEFNEDFTSLEAMKSLRGLAAFGILFHHISQEPFFQEEGVLSVFVNAGVYFVAIFFFCSGYGLVKSFDTKKDYLKGFMKKRVLKAIVVPFYIDVIIYGILIFLMKIPKAGTQWVTNFLGLTMMNTYAWFPIVLTLLYIVFYFCFMHIKNRKVSFAIIFAFMILMAMIFCVEGHYAWWYGPKNWWMSDQYWMNWMKWWQGDNVFWFSGEWWVNTAPAFLAGLIFATYEEKITAFFKKDFYGRFSKLLIITLLLDGLSSFGQGFFGYWSEWEGNGPAIGDKIITYFLQIPVLFIFAPTVFIFMMKYHVENPVTRFFGKYALHTYLMNLAAITFCRFIEVPDMVICVGDVKNNLLIYAVSVVLLSVLLGMAEQKITDQVQYLLFAKKVKKVVDHSRPVLLEGDGKHATKHSVKKEADEEEKKEKEKDGK